MGKLKYVVISDLHLGAFYSVLTDLKRKKNGSIELTKDGSPRVEPDKSSPTLEEFGKALSIFLKLVSDDEEKPTLVLLGDVLDQAFATTLHSTRTFARFAETLFPAAESESQFQSEILYLPGNHDHREWQVTRDHIFLDSVKHTPDGREPTQSAICTALFTYPDKHSYNRMLTALIRRTTKTRGRRDDLLVKTAYPNLGFIKGDKYLILHHGHYIETTYRAISILEHWFKPETPLSTSIFGIERINGPWIDFLWSTTGDGGKTAKDVINLFEIMQDAGASRDFTKLISDRIAESINMTQVGPSSHISVKGFSLSPKGLIRAALDYMVGKGVQAERMAFDTALSESGLEGLNWYLSGPVRKQIKTKHKQDKEAAQKEQEDHHTTGLPDENIHPHEHEDVLLHRKPPFVVEKKTTFVFGHTHKPFEGRVVPDGYAFPVDVFNTGGWVLDSPSMSPTQGAALVFIDDDLNTASLRLYHDDPNESAELPAVEARGSGGPDDQSNSMLEQLKKALEAEPNLWDDFQNTFRREADIRGRLIRRKYFKPELDPPGPVNGNAKQEESS